MKRIDDKEFHDRLAAVARARKIFTPHITKNISIAFDLYQEILAEQERKRFLTSISGGRVPPSWIDRYERPRCPECQESLYLRIVREPKGKGNQKGWRTCWECVAPNCFFEEYSKKTVEEWMKELRRKEDA
jgi:hypothetical protein